MSSVPNKLSVSFAREVPVGWFHKDWSEVGRVLIKRVRGQRTGTQGPLSKRDRVMSCCVKKSRSSRKNERNRSVQFEEAGERGRFEEEGKMDVDEDVDSKKKLGQRKKEV